MKKILVLAFAVPMIALTGCGRQNSNFNGFNNINSQAYLPPSNPDVNPCAQAALPPGYKPPSNPCQPKPVYPCASSIDSQAALPPGYKPPSSGNPCKPKPVYPCTQNIGTNAALPPGYSC